MSNDSEATRCRTCGTVSPFAVDSLCNNCRQVEQGLDAYLANRAGRVNVLRHMSVEELAHAILDMGNLGFNKGEGPNTLAGCRLWDDLSDSALLVGGRSRRSA